MNNIEDFPVAARRLTEYEALVAAGASALDAIPGAVYICDRDGWLVQYNSEAAELWGQRPAPETRPRFCGSHALYLPDGSPLAHEDCPMATAVRDGTATRNAEGVMARPDGTRFTALVNIRALHDHKGNIQGAINCFQDISAQKAIQSEIARKHAELEDFFENSAIGLHIVSGDGTILRANKAELDMLGYTAEEYVGRHIAEFHADAHVIGEILHLLSSGERLDRHPARLRARDGSIKHVLITSNSRFEDGNFVNTRCFTTDVTDLYEAEAARSESEKRLAATYEAATVGIAEADADRRLLRVNDAICKILGYSREELQTMRFTDYTDGDDAREDAELYARQVRGEIDNYVLRKKARKADGAIVYLDINSSSVRDSKGNFLYGVRVIQDVTLAKQMEDAILESERQIRDLLDALPAALYKTDATGRITFYNKAAVEMSGRVPQPGDMWCVTWKLYNTDGTPLPHDQCPMAVALKEGRPVRGAEAVAERPDGTRVPFIPYPTPLYDAQGKLIGAINMLVDITERKQAENRQKILIDELNHRVKNTLATVLSLASQTARHSSDVKDYSRRFGDRLLALARAHDLLTRRHWESAPLDQLAREVLTPLAGESADRITIEGPAIELNPKAALNFTMTLNELVTNACKYGALAVDEGKVTVAWQLSGGLDGQLRFDWRETGGPEVVPPTRRGVGTRIIETCMERDLGGELDLGYEPEGVSCRIALPLEAVRA